MFWKSKGATLPSPTVNSNAYCKNQRKCHKSGNYDQPFCGESWGRGGERVNVSRNCKNTSSFTFFKLSDFFTSLHECLFVLQSASVQIKYISIIQLYTGQLRGNTPSLLAPISTVLITVSLIYFNSKRKGLAKIHLQSQAQKQDDFQVEWNVLFFI